MDPDAGTKTPLSTTETLPGMSTHKFNFTTVEADRILQGIEGNPAFLNVPSLSDIKRNLEAESKRKINLELHLLTLSEYYKNHRIPRGMRSQLRPTMFVTNMSFRERFEAISNAYARDIILLNMDYLQGELSLIKKKVLHFDNLLKGLLNPQEYTSHIEKLETYMAKFRTEIEEIKKRKWYRDINDYSNGKVYNWKTEFTNFDERRNFPRRNRDAGTRPLEQPFLGSRQTPLRPGTNPQGEGDVTANEAARTRSQKKLMATRQDSGKKKTTQETPS